MGKNQKAKQAQLTTIFWNIDNAAKGIRAMVQIDENLTETFLLLVQAKARIYAAIPGDKPKWSPDWKPGLNEAEVDS